MARFDHPLLDQAVAPGLVTSSSARIWVRASEPGPHTVTVEAVRGDGGARAALAITEGMAVDQTGAAELTGLAPGRQYAFRVTRGDALVGEGRFETAPESADRARDRFAFAVASCHLPFDTEGRVDDRAMRMLAVAEKVLEERDVTRVLFVGDQVYADMPTGLSLFDPEHFGAVFPNGREDILACTEAQIRAAYQERYRRFWNLEPYRRIMACWPTLPMLDDHEIIDNWGSAPVHLEPDWQKLARGARWAYLDYQGSRVRERGDELPRSFHYAFDYGPVSCFVMDLRSERVSTKAYCKPFSDAQLDDLARFLREHASQPVVMIVITVPILNAPKWAMKVGEIVYGGEHKDPGDRWQHPRMHEARDRLMFTLREHQRRHPEQRVLLVGGDVHFGLASEIAWHGLDARLVQLVSSPISNRQGALFSAVSKLVPGMRVTFEREGESYATGSLVPAERGQCPFGNLNMGIVTFVRRGDGWKIVLELVSFDEDGPPSPRVVYRSAEL